MRATSQCRDERESVGCIFCGEGPTDLYANAKSLHDERAFSVVQCPKCQLTYTNPRIANKEAEIEGHGPQPPSEFDARTLRRSAAAAELQIMRLERVVPPGKLLDFGCGTGALVDLACRRGWDAIGADIDKALIEASNAHWGCRRLFPDNVEALVRKHGRAFDAITSIQVFEHLTNPLETLSRMRLLLRPGGVVLVDVPNLSAIGERLRKGSSLDPTAHLYYFTPRTVRMLFERAGFEVLCSSGAPNLLGTFYSVLGNIHRPRLASKLADLTRALPLPPIGSGVYVIGRV